MNTLMLYNQKRIKSLNKGKGVLADFRSGDTLKVSTKVKEGTSERIQVFAGVCIARRCSHNGIGSTFTVRKLAHGVNVEKTFLLYSPRIDSIEVTQHGKVRRAKLYYLSNLTGKAARIKERR